jgi:hypothetical protein
MFPTRAITILGGDSFRDEYSLEFDGSNDYIDTGSNFESTVFNSAFSVSLWVKLDDGRPSATEYLFGTKDGNDSIWGRVETDGDIQLFYKEGSAEEALVASAYFADGASKWTHLIFVISDSAQAIYANGVLIASNTTSLSTSGFAQDTNRNFIIGARNNAGSVGDGVAGKISDFALYTKALSASEVSTIYNGREPYNHKEGSFSGSLYSWWRMGDGSANNIKFSYIDNSAINTSISTITSSTFDSNTDGWASYNSGTVSHSTTISSYSGSGGVLKSVNDATNVWFGKTDNITSGMESGKIYVASAWVYIPSSWSGTRTIYLSAASTFNETIGEYITASASIKDSWQYLYQTFLCKEDSGSGAVYLRTSGTDDLEDGDFIYFDDFKLEEITNASNGIMINMTPSDFTGDTP